MTQKLLAIVTDELDGAEPIEELRRDGTDGVEVRVIAPAIEASAFRHTLGDVDEPKLEARERLEATLAHLREAGVMASGDIGDPDPIQAAEDALREGPADEVLIFEHVGRQTRWFEDGLFERFQEHLEPPLRMVVFGEDESGEEHVLEIEEADSGVLEDHEHEIGSSYVPNLSRADFAGMFMGIFGTITAIVLAAVAAANAGGVTGWTAFAIGIAIAIALINMAHVVGLTLFETVRYRGGFARFFRSLSIVATPAAVLVNLLIVLLD